MALAPGFLKFTKTCGVLGMMLRVALLVVIILAAVASFGQGAYTSPQLTAGAALTLNYSTGSLFQGGAVISITGATLSMTDAKSSCAAPAYSSCNIVYWTSGSSLSTTTSITTASAPGNIIVGFVTTSGGAILLITHANVNTPIAPGVAMLAQSSTPQAVSTQFSLGGNKVALTADFTDANASGLQVITGLAFTIPSSVSGNIPFHCSLAFSQATPSASDQFGVAVLTTAPTRLDAFASVSTNTTATAYGALANLASTTPTAIVTFTQVASGTSPAYLDGVAQLAGGGTQTLQFYVTNGTAANVIVIKAGSFCTIW